MKLLFVRPKPSADTIGLQHLMIVEPLELEILATLISNDHQVEIVDMILEKDPFDFFLLKIKPDVLCLTGYITHIQVIKEYCKQAKSLMPDVVTITGGVHVEKFPEDIDSEYIDYRVVRNAVKIFPQLIAYINGTAHLPGGVLRTNEKLDESLLPDYDFNVPIPDRSLTRKYRKDYFYVFHNKVALLKTSFGCPYKCKFCFCRKITGDKYYARPLNDIMEELQSIEEKEVYIVDDDFLVNKHRLADFLALLIELGIKKKYLVYGRADFIASNPALIKEFKDQGLRTVIVGLESFDNIELHEFNKQTSSDINRSAMKILNQYSIDCYAAVIVSPSWGKEDFRKAGDIMLGLGIKFVNLQPLTPLKGTGIVISEKDLVVERCAYAKWDLAHVTIRPQKMSLQDFYNNILELYVRIIMHPRNLLSNLKYSWAMQIKLSKGMKKVRDQYKNQISESMSISRTN
jgi:hopanoid C-3 methylase